MKICVLDAATLGEDLDMSPLYELGEVNIYQYTDDSNIADRICDTDVIIINKVKLNASNLCYAKSLKLICIAATGYDNIDVNYCREHSVAVCNVKGYSTNSVAQITLSMVLALASHLNEYNEFVRCGDYSKSQSANRLTPVYHELSGLKWGIVGYGNIGKGVGAVANALGCHVLACKRTPDNDPSVEYVDIDTLCEISDIITVHTPLSDSTRNLINEERIAKMKPSAILVNVARGAVTDEAAIAKALKEGRLGAFGCDVYSSEPFRADHPFSDIKDLPNVCLTPHMAWGAYEARVRCLDEIIKNIKCFFAGEIHSRVDV